MDDRRSVSNGASEARALAEAAAQVLRDNDLGSSTKAAPNLYPHQWSWDSAFVAIGWAHLDLSRAALELQSLLAAQWATGLIPHIVFNPQAPPGSYFPDGDWWDVQRLASAAPRHVQTSGICQPPVHAIAALRIWDIAACQDAAAREAALTFLRAIYPRLLRWHRYLATARDPERSGLITIYHPWESGTDNSPRWDSALAAVTVGALPPYARADLQHVSDPAERPTRADYDRYVWLVELLKRARYDDASVYAAHPFVVKDILFSAIFCAANAALQRCADVVAASDADRAEIAEWIARGQRGQDRQWDAALGLTLDCDARSGQPYAVRTVAGFAPLIAGQLAAERRAALVTTFESDAFIGHPGLRWPLPPSTSPHDPGFRPRSYWRGPTWPIVTWLLWWAFQRDGDAARACGLRQAALEQARWWMLRPDGDAAPAQGFAEYADPFTGEALGSSAQSWTAAVVLDWLGTVP